MTFSMLPDDALKEVQRTAIDLGFAGDAALNVGISPAFVAKFSVGNNDVSRLITLTSRMNSTRALSSGEVPTKRYFGGHHDVGAECLAARNRVQPDQGGVAYGRCDHFPPLGSSVPPPELVGRGAHD